MEQEQNQKSVSKVSERIEEVRDEIFDVLTEYGEDIFDIKQRISDNESEIERISEEVDNLKRRNQNQLNETQFEVLMGIKDGKKQKKIADELDVSEPWVSKVKSNLKDRGFLEDE